MIHCLSKILCSDKPVEILAPNAILKSLREVTAEQRHIRRDVVGHSNMGQPIELYQVGSGPINTLWYGFPDPGEAVGGATILKMLEYFVANEDSALLHQFSWHFIPCINPDDQPDAGESLKKVMKTSQQEIDWLLENPRAETSILIECAENIRPHFTFPLHDEYHCADLLPIYCPVSRVLPREKCEAFRNYVTECGFEVNREFDHKDMGAGFFNMMEEADIIKSTFSVFNKFGLVGICEMPFTNKAKAIVGLQLAFGGMCLDYVRDNY